MTQDVLAVLITLLTFASLAVVIGYYILDHNKSLRERPFMRSIRGLLEVASTALSNGVRSVGKIALVVCIAALGLVIVLAVVKWALEELAK